MILAPVISAAGQTLDTPVTVRLIGILDRVLVESLANACAGLTVSGRRTLVILVRDLEAARDENLDRLLATLQAYRSAGHRVFIEATPAWRKMVRGRGGNIDESTDFDGRASRRQIIICHSSDKRGAA